MSPSLDVVIVNWNSGEQLRECLASLAASSRANVDLKRVVVVDNGSADGSAVLEPAPDLPMTVLENAENRGFAVACNQGARGSSSDFLLFLNPDTRVRADSLSGPVRFLAGEEASGVGIVGVRLLGDDGQVAKSCARFPTLTTFVSEALGLNRVLPGRVQGLFLTEFDHGTRSIVEHVSGAFYLIRRPLFEDLGGFDERFFVYLEDLDLSRRAWLTGWRSVFAAEWEVFHCGGGVSRAVPATRLFYALRSRIVYVFKHLSRPQAWLVLLVTLGLEPISRTVLSLLQGRPSQVLTTARAYLRLWREVPGLLSKGFREARA